MQPPGNIRAHRKGLGPGMHHGADTRVQIIPMLDIVFALTLTLLCCGCGGYNVVVNFYDADRAFPGSTYFESRSGKRLLCVDMEGNVLWDYQDQDRLFPGEMNGFQCLPDGSVLFLHMNRRFIVEPTTNTILYQDNPVGVAHHDVAMTPMGTILYISNVLIANPTLGRIVEVTRPGQKVWEMFLEGAVPGMYHTVYCCQRVPFEEYDPG